MDNEDEAGDEALDTLDDVPDDDEVEDVLIGGGGGGRLSVKERFSLLSILSDLK